MSCFGPSAALVASKLGHKEIGKIAAGALPGSIKIAGHKVKTRLRCSRKAPGKCLFRKLKLVAKHKPQTKKRKAAVRSGKKRTVGMKLRGKRSLRTLKTRQKALLRCKVIVAGKSRRSHVGSGSGSNKRAAIGCGPIRASVHHGRVPGSVKTEAVVLRSIRYGEADRILHLYSPDRGRVNAIAKGSRRPKSRFGGRLEPFYRLDLMLHEGRGELMTVTGASTIDGYASLRESGPAIGAATSACDAVLRLFDSTEPNRPAYKLLCRYLAMIDANPGETPAEGSSVAPTSRGAALAFRLKLALAAGFAPELHCLRAMWGTGRDRRLLRRRRRRRLRFL